MKSKCCNSELISYDSHRGKCIKCGEINKPEPLLKLHEDYRQVEVEGISVVVHKDVKCFYIYENQYQLFLMCSLDDHYARTHGMIVCAIDRVKDWRTLIWKIEDGKAIRIESE